MLAYFKWLIFIERDSPLLSVTGRRNKLPPLGTLGTSQSQRAVCRDSARRPEGGPSASVIGRGGIPERVVSLETMPVGQAPTH